MILFAHHVELEHLPVLAVFASVGVWLGWRVCTVVLNAVHSRQREKA